MKKHRLLSSAAALLFIPSLVLASTAERFEAHMTFLASDLLEGRETGKRGYDLAAQYVETELRKYGVKPANNGSYRQTVQLRSGHLDLNSPKFTVSHGETRLSFSFPDEMATYAELTQSEIDLQGEMVFVGFGLHAPYLNHSDLDKIDLTGKIAVLVQGYPENFPSEEVAHYKRQTTRALARHGAIGAIYLNSPEREEQVPFTRLKSWVSSSRLSWLDAQQNIAYQDEQLGFRVYLSMDASRQFASLTGLDIDAVYQTMADSGMPEAQPLRGRAGLTSSSQLTHISSDNVLGLIEGSDPALKDEYVVLTAHLDHVGISRNSVMKDKINNGAMDNASGVTSLLEIARAMALQDKAPARSVIFAFVTAEEKGLVGSDYLAQHPPVALDSIVANINIDMPILTYRTNEIIAFGEQHSSLSAAIRTATEQHNMQLVADPAPEQVIFVRSDQYSFVRQGVPSLYLTPGFTPVEGDTGMSNGEFLKNHYHMPSDDLSLPIDYQWAADFTQLNLDLINIIANDPDRPTWNPDSFFATFAK